MAPVSQKYLSLIKAFPLRRIKSAAELERATAVMQKLVDAGSLTVAEEDYLDILGDLIEEYEQAAAPIEELTPREVLAEAMKTRGVTPSAFAEATGIPVSTISELLSEKRDFNVSHIAKLCAHFGLGPSAFIAVELVEK
jgi:HTH-type transcriptional regulator/antitoxin HigA